MPELTKQEKDAMEWGSTARLRGEADFRQIRADSLQRQLSGVDKYCSMMQGIELRSEPMTMPRLVALLGVDGWKDATEPWTSGNCYLSKDNQLHLCITSDGWELQRFTDSDVETEYGTRAVGRYQTIDEGEHFHEIMEAIRCAETRTERQVEA